VRASAQSAHALRADDASISPQPLAVSQPSTVNVTYRAVLFDFDGTLLPSLPLWVKAYQLALRHFEIRMSDEELVRRCFFRDWHVVAAVLGVESVDDLRGQVDLGLKEAFLEAALFPFALPLVRHCRSHGLATALVTSSPRHVVNDVLPRVGLELQFDCIVCADDVVRHKPHPEPLLKALTVLGHEAKEAVMVGDSRVDILAGKAAGTATALFLANEDETFHSLAELRATEPDHIFSDHRELPGMLGLPQFV
jgi:pyrophosphatase PpaX